MLVGSVRGFAFLAALSASGSAFAQNINSNDLLNLGLQLLLQPPAQQVQPQPQRVQPQAQAPQRQTQSAPSQPRYSRADVTETQRLLTLLGYDPGPIDGAMGRRTAAAIRDFERDLGLPVTGQPGQGVIVALRLDAERRQATGTLPQRSFGSGPSFDCNRAGTATEFAICGNAGLADLDATLARVFGDRAALLDPASLQRLRAEQQAWLASRDSCGGNPACLDAAMRFRLSQLSAGMPGAGFAAGTAGTAGGFAPLPMPGAGDAPALSDMFTAAAAGPGAAPDAGEPDLVLYASQSSDLIRAAREDAAETGRLLTIAAVKARPDLAEADAAVRSLVAELAPERFLGLLNAEGAGAEPQTERYVAAYRSTGQPGQLLQVLNFLSPFAQSRVTDAARADLAALLDAVDAPALPVRVRVFCEIGFSAYDLEAQTFPNDSWQNDAMTCAQVDLGRMLPGGVTAAGRLSGVPTELRLPPAEAEAFLAALSPGGYDRNTMGRPLAASYVAEIGPPDIAVGPQGARVELPLTEIGGWQLHLRSDLSRVVHRYPDATAALPGALMANPDGTYSYDGRTVLVFGRSGRPEAEGVGPFADQAPALRILSEKAYFAALAGLPDPLADGVNGGPGLIALFPESDWPSLLAEAVGAAKAEAALAGLPAVRDGNRSRQDLIRNLDYQLRLNEFERARLVETLRTRLPGLIAARAANGPIALRVWCEVSLGAWEAAEEILPLYPNGCSPDQLAQAAPGSVGVQSDNQSDGMADVPRTVPAPIAEAEALALALAAPENPDDRRGWLSFDATLTGAALDRGSGQLYPYLVWEVAGPFRLHRKDAPLETLVEIAVEARPVVLEGEALRAAKLAGEMPWDPNLEADVADLAAMATGALPMPDRVQVALTVYPDPAGQVPGMSVPVLRAASNQGRNIADVFGRPEGQIVQLANLSPVEIEIGAIFALLPADAAAYTVVWPDAMAEARNAQMQTLLDVSVMRVEADRNFGFILVLEAVPVAARVFPSDAPAAAVELDVAPVEVATVPTVAFAPSAWLATEVAAMKGIDSQAFLIELAGQVEGDPFLARDLAAEWHRSAAESAPPEDAFWIAGQVVFDAYDFDSESFPMSGYPRWQMPDVDGAEAPVFNRLRLQFPDGAMALRLPPDEARAWQESTGLVGQQVPIRARVRLAYPREPASDSFYFNADLLALEVLTPGAAVTLVEPDKIAWRSEEPVTWAAAAAGTGGVAATPTPETLAPETPAAPAPVEALPAAIPPAVTPPAATDIAGLTVGMSAEDFRAAALALYEGGALALVTATPDPAETWGTVTGFTDAGMRQTVLAVHPPGRPDGPVIALVRRLALPPGAATPEAVRLSLAEKYGPDALDAGGYASFWGLPADQQAELACAPLRAGFGRAPALTLDPGADVEVGSSVSQPGIWGQLLIWPPEAQDSAAFAQVDPATLAGCGPVIVAAIREEAGGGLDLTVWAFDMGEMARRLADPSNAPPAAKAADIKL